MKKYRFPSLLLAVLVMVQLLSLPAFALEEPQLSCANAILVDANYDEVLYEKGGYDKVYPASITKVMTALLTLEAIDRGELSVQTQVTASQSAVTVPEGSSTADIQAGETLTVEQLLYCLLLPSANEAAQILAETVGGDIPTFVEMMNQRAQELGCQNTHFANPHGFHDPDHYTTPYDITLFMKAAMEYGLFQTIVTSPNYTLPATQFHTEERTIRNTNALTSNWKYLGYLYSKGTGGKTGSTDEAGECLVETAKDGDTYLISVIMDAQDVTLPDGTVKKGQFYNTIQLLDWGFENFHHTTISQDSAPVASVKVTLSDQTDQVMVKPEGVISRTLPKEVDVDNMETTINLFSDTVEAPVTEGQVLGTMTLSYEGEVYGVLDLVADSSVERSELLYRKAQVVEFFQNSGVKLLLAVVLVVVAVVLLRVLVFRKSRRYRASAGVGRRGHYSGRRRR